MEGGREGGRKEMYFKGREGEGIELRRVLQEGGREGEREGGRDGEREGGMERGREGERERGREGERERGREGGSDGAGGYYD